MTSSSNEMLAGDQVLSRAAGMVAAARADFTRDAARLEHQISGLRGRWQGAGGQAFFALQQAWSERQRVIVAALDGFEHALRSTERDNVGTDETQQGYQLSLASRLGGLTR
jgi:WXG100 family type VII secretion target